MTAPVIFNRRLGKNEIELYLNLIDNTGSESTANRAKSAKFLQLNESIAFVSSIEDEIIGGSIVYRDRTRLGMVLVSIVVKEEYRDQGLYTIIKSSLPFFRTGAIRDVDAVVSESPTGNNLEFPSSFCLPTWSIQVLERIGFTKEQNLFSYFLEIDKKNSFDHEETNFDMMANLEGARSLIWDEGKTLGLTNSLVWMSLDFARYSNTLRTVTEGSFTKLVFSIDSQDGEIILGLIAAREEFCKRGRATNILVSAIRETKMTNIIFPLIGDGQVDFMETIADEIGGSLKKKPIILMRRRL